jgi:hypothetical protein
MEHPQHRFFFRIKYPVKIYAGKIKEHNSSACKRQDLQFHEVDQREKWLMVNQ